MAAGEIRAGRAYVELAAKGDLKGVLNKAALDLKAFGASVIAIGAKMGVASAAISAPLMFAIHESRGAGAELADLSTVTGVSAERLSELQQAAIGLGGSADMMGRAIRGAGAFMVEAAQGSQGALQSLAMLRLRFEDLRDLGPDEVVRRLGQALSNIPNAFQRAQVQAQIFTDGSGQMARVLGATNEQWQRQIELARANGTVMSTEDVAAANALNRAWNTMTAAVSALWQKIGAALAPSFTTLLELFTEGITWLVRWVDENRGLVRIIDLTATGLAVIGGALTGVGGAMAAVSFVVGGLAIGVGVLGTALTMAAGLLVGAISAIITFLGALLPMVPIVALVGAGLVVLAGHVAVATGIIIAAGYAVYTYWDEIVAAIRQAMDAIADAAAWVWAHMTEGAHLVFEMWTWLWGQIGDAARTVFGVVVDAAGKAWSMVSDAASWAFGEMAELWDQFAVGFGEVWAQITASIGSGNLQDAFAVGVAGIRLLWVQVTNYLTEKWIQASNFIGEVFEQVWASVIAGIKSAWAGAVGWMAEQLVHLIDLLPGPLRRQLVGGASTDQLLSTIRADTQREQEQAAREAELDPNRESQRRRQERLEEARASGRDREQAAHEELEAAMNAAAAGVEEAERRRAQARQRTQPPGQVLGRIEGVRGTFSGAALSGLATSAGNPVVDALRTQTSAIERVEQAINDIGDYMSRLGLQAG
jgi:hypothetical protein